MFTWNPKTRHIFTDFPNWPFSPVTILKLFLFPRPHLYILRLLLLLLSFNYHYHLHFWFQLCRWETYSSLFFSSLFLYLYPTVWHKSVAVSVILWQHFLTFYLGTLLFRSNTSHNTCQCQLNLLKSTGYVMHHQFNIQQLYALPTLYLCGLYLSENKERLVPLTA